jgi:heme A synthase
MNALRTIFRYWLLLMLALVVLQIAFAGYGAFDTADKVANGSVDEQSFEDSFGLHIGFGYLVLLAGLITLLLALAARVGRRNTLHALGIFGLLIVQVLLAWTGGAVPFVFGALHPINAFLILGAVGSLAMRQWRGAPVEGVAAEPLPPPA